MTLVFAAKALSSLSFIFFFGSYGCLLYGQSPNLFPSFFTIVFSIILCYIIDMRFGEKARFYPLPICLISLMFANGLPSLVVISLAIVLAFLTVYKRIYISGYGEAVDTFNRNLSLTLFMFVLSIVFNIFGKLSSSVLPFLVIYFISSVLELSMLRHNDETIIERRFQLLNGSILGISCLVGFFMSTQLFLNFSQFIIGSFLKYVVSPCIMVIASITTAIVYGLMLFFTEVVFKNSDIKGGKVIFPELSNGLVDDLRFDEWTNTVDVIGETVLAVILIAIIALFIYRLVKKQSTRESDTGIEYRTKDVVKKSPPPNLSSEVKGIRNIYRKFLLLLHSKGLVIPHSYTSLDIEKNIDTELNDITPAKELRQFYLKARYSDETISKEDYKTAKDLYSKIKKDNVKLSLKRDVYGDKLKSIKKKAATTNINNK